MAELLATVLIVIAIGHGGAQLLIVWSYGISVEPRGPLI